MSNNKIINLKKDNNNKNHDKKNDDKKINFILLKDIGKTTQPNKNKITLKDLKKFSNLLINRNF